MRGALGSLLCGTFIILVILMYQVEKSLSQECTDPCTLPLTSCTFIDYPVYSSPSLSVPANEATANSIFRFLPKINNPMCVEAVKRVVCGTQYPKCESVLLSDGSVSASPSPPCMQMCDDLNMHCGSYLEYLPAEIKFFANCSEINEDGKARYSSSNSTCYTLKNLTPVQNCLENKKKGENYGEQQANNDVNSDDDDLSGYAGGCQDFQKELTPETYDFCAPFVSTRIFVSNVSDATIQTSMDAFLNNSSMGDVKKSYMLMSASCHKHLVSFLCQSTFSTCQIAQGQRMLTNGTVTNVNVEVGNPPCAHVCEGVNSECSDFFYASRFMPFNCSQMISDTVEVRRWPNSTYEAVVGNYSVNVTVTCAADIFPASPSVSKFVLPPFDHCPSMLKRKSNPSDSEPRCWIPCPDPTYTSSEWDVLIFLSQFFAAFSFIAMFFLLASYMIDYKRRNYPQNTHIFQFFSLMLCAAGFFVGGTNRKDNVMCIDDATYSTAQNNHACAAQGFLFIFGALSAMTWWTVLGFTCLTTIVFEQKKSKGRKMMWYFHLWGWGVPSVLTIVSFAYNTISYSSPIAWCFYVTQGADGAGLIRQQGKRKFLEDYGLFYIPIGICIVITIVMLSCVFVKIINVVKAAKKVGTVVRIKKRKAQLRIIKFVLVLLIMYTLVLEFRLSLTDARITEIKDAGAAWLDCKLRTELDLPNPGMCPTTIPPKRVSYGHTTMLTIVVASFGLATFFTFGTDRKIYIHWRKVLFLIYYKKWRQLRNLVFHGKEHSSETFAVGNIRKSITTDTTYFSHPQAGGNRSSSILTNPVELNAISSRDKINNDKHDEIK